MEKVVLKATRRTVTGKQVRALRRAGELPAILYGHNVEPTAISMNAKEAGRVLGRLSASSLVTIDLDGKEYPTLVRERQREPIKAVLIHLDFQAVSLTEKIRANVGIVLTGTSGAVKDFSAILVTTLNELEVEAFPQDLPERIVVDIAKLEKIGDGIHVSDLVLSDKVHIVSGTDEMIVLAAAPKEEVEEVAPTEAEVAVEEGTEPEVIEKGKKEEEGEEEGKEKEKEKK
jgi:large subunit ribosomal protein L25